MRYAKKLNDTEIKDLNPYYIEHNGTIYTNPLNNPNLNLKALGYKELVVNDMPTIDNETQTIEMYYEETENNIYRKWRVRNLTEEEKEAMAQMRALAEE